MTVEQIFMHYGTVCLSGPERGEIKITNELNLRLGSESGDW